MEWEEAEKAIQKVKEWQERQLTDLTGIKQNELFKNLEEKRESLFMELKSKDEELELTSVDLEGALYETLKTEIDKLKQELAEKSKDLEYIKLENGEQKAEISQLKGKLYYSLDKSSPTLPVKEEAKQSVFKQLKAKTKVMIQKLIKKRKTSQPRNDCLSRSKGK